MDNNQCMCLKTGPCYVCHIAPYGAGKRPDKTARLGKLLQWTASVVFADSLKLRTPLTAKRRFGKKPGCFDYRWNLVCLNPVLPNYWGDFRLAVKVLGVQDIPEEHGMSRIKLQLVWMPRRNGEPLEPIPQTVEGWNNAFNRYHNGDGTGQPPLVGRSQAGQPAPPQVRGNFLLPGVKTRHVDRSVMAWRLQWPLVNMAALAGGAEAIDRMDRDPPNFFASNGYGEWLGLVSSLRRRWTHMTMT